MGLWRKLSWLSTLYIVQGLPYGFQGVGLKLYLREAGISLTEIALIGFIALPWSLKALWAPAVDRFGSKRLGRRRSWILPLQALLATVLAIAAFSPPDKLLGMLLGLLICANFFASTMDIAVDGLAIDLLETEKLGFGNIAQVVGFKVGMLLGGGLLPSLTAGFGWPGLFFTMSGLVWLAWLVTLFSREPVKDSADKPVAPGEVLRRLKEAFFQSKAPLLLGTVAFYKLGEKMADEVFGQMLIDAGFAVEQVSLWSGGWGMGFSIAGSFAGGILASRVRLVDALLFAATARIIPHAAQMWLASGATDDSSAIIGVICAEAFFGGALTTVMFAFMMSKVDKRIGASHYTLLATVEVWGKSPSGLIAGLVGDTHGYVPVFFLATALSAAYLILPWLMRRREAPPPTISAF